MQQNNLPSDDLSLTAWLTVPGDLDDFIFYPERDDQNGESQR